MERQDAPTAKWWQLAFGVLCMAMIANLQYGWTLFVDPIDAQYHWGRASIQLAFTIFVATETWLVPVEAWFVDKYGPKVVVAFGGIMIALAWVINAYAGVAADPLSRRGGRRRRRRFGLRHLCRQRVEVVPGSPRTGRRSHRRRVRRGRRDHRGSDRQDDRFERLPERVPHLRPRPGRRRGVPLGRSCASPNSPRRSSASA